MAERAGKPHSLAQKIIDSAHSIYYIYEFERKATARF
jgi:hypothetical protein